MGHPNPPIRAVRRRPDFRRGYPASDRRRWGAPAAIRQERFAAARHRNRTAPATTDPVILGAATWLACGIVLLGLTPLPLHDAHLGWSFTFWALAAPLLVLLAKCACARKPRSLRTPR